LARHRRGSRDRPSLATLRGVRQKKDAVEKRREATYWGRGWNGYEAMQGMGRAEGGSSSVGACSGLNGSRASYLWYQGMSRQNASRPRSRMYRACVAL